MIKQQFWQAISTSVIGPAHSQTGSPNQDAVKIKIKKNTVIAAVSDGVGSAKHADIGAENACKVVIESVELWLKSEFLEIIDLLRLIQILWLIRIRPFKADECAATLLFVIILPSKRVIMAQLGDGVVLHWNGTRLEHCLMEEKEGFSNETYSLQESGILSKWKIKDFELPGDRNSFILLTDGISENIEEGQLDEFAKITDLKLRRMNCNNNAEQWLIEELENWQTPFHSDDKTIAVLQQKDKE